MSEGLQRSAEEDPTFRCFTNEETGQLHHRGGMGELHLEIICDRLKREFKVEANTGAPQIAYRETITKPRLMAKANSSVSPVVAVNTATPASRFSPNEKGKGVEVDNEIVGGTIPKEYIPVVMTALKKPSRAASMPAIRSSTCKVQVTARQFHEVDSNELAFKMAASSR